MSKASCFKKEGTMQSQPCIQREERKGVRRGVRRRKGRKEDWDKKEKRGRREIAQEKSFVERNKKE